MKLYQFIEVEERVLGIKFQPYRSSELIDMAKMNPAQKTGGKSDGMKLVGEERKGEVH